MKAIAVGAVAVTVLTSPAWTGAASAAPSPTGPLCGLAAVSDPQIPRAMTGVLFGGPVAMTDDTDPTVTYQGTLECTVQTGTDNTHAEATQAIATGSTGVLSAVWATVTYEHGEAEDTWVCSSVTIEGGPTLYWDAPGARWSPSSASECDLVTSAEVGGTAARSLLDPVVCPVFALAFPPEGDVPGVWDCPPHSDDPLRDTEVHWVVPPVAGG